MSHNRLSDRTIEMPMYKEHTHAELTEEEMRLGILQVLYAARQRRPNGGAAGKMLMDCLNAALPRLEQALHWLIGQDFIEVGERVFLITNKGIEYLIERLGPLGPGGKPPTDPSRVPRRPLPATGDSSIALPLPQTESTGDT